MQEAAHASVSARDLCEGVVCGNKSIRSHNMKAQDKKQYDECMQ
jgi:hypothetical protein